MSAFKSSLPQRDISSYVSSGRIAVAVRHAVNVSFQTISVSARPRRNVSFAELSVAPQHRANVALGSKTAGSRRPEL